MGPLLSAPPPDSDGGGRAAHAAAGSSCSSRRPRRGPRRAAAAPGAAALGAAALGGLPVLAGAQELQVEVAAPAWVVDPRGQRGPGAGEVFLRHPWPIQASSSGAGQPSPSASTRDGVEVVVRAPPEVLPAGAAAALYVGLFSISLTGAEDSVEKWLAEGNMPPQHNPLRLTSLFNYQYPRGVQPDELGDACLGDHLRVEFCARVTSCFRVVGAGGGGGSWRVAAPAEHASSYRFEAYLGPAGPGCLEAPAGPAAWAPPVAEHTAPFETATARHAGHARFRLLFVGHSSWWWGHHAQVDPVASWLEMMGAAVEAAAGSPAARGADHGLWLEFGVGSGKTTVAITAQLGTLLGNSAVLHGFDSFQGLPSSWEHTKLEAGTFSTGGQVPEHLVGRPNVQVHVGLFSDTLGDLDRFGAAPVAFAHIDVDLFSSAVQVLDRIACQLHPGTILVFDELVNYAGFELSGEYRAWEHIAAKYEIRWDYAGIFWQQAVPVFVTERGAAC